jgi:hypothetical protein
MATWRGAAANSLASPAAGAVAPAVTPAVEAAKPGFFESLKSGNLLEAAKTAGSGVMDLAKNNPSLAMMLGNTVASMADSLSGKSDAEVNLALSKANLNQAEADQIRRAIELERERRARLNAGYLNVNQGININPNAIPGGLIANARYPA